MSDAFGDKKSQLKCVAIEFDRQEKNPLSSALGMIFCVCVFEFSDNFILSEK